MPQNDTFMSSEQPSKFVSRGGLKLQHALSNFKIQIANFVVLDVGSSTGGFVDCLLQNGAAKVFAVDTAYGEFAWKLRNDPRVVVMERTNILHLESLPKTTKHNQVIHSAPTVILSEAKNIYPSATPQDDSIKTGNDDVEKEDDKADNNQLVDLITIDASWTKLEKILPVVQKFLKPDGYIIALLKPHYQADKSLLVKGILDEGEALRVKGEVESKIQDLGFKIREAIDSPILGGGGNHEYLLLITSG